jgi:bacterial/archaeal transporter family protein
MQSWIIFAILSAVFAALTALFIKLGTQTVDSDVATFYRTIIIFVITAVIIYFRGKKLSLGETGGKEIMFLGLSGVATGLSWLAYFRAIKDGPLSKVSLIDKSSVLLIVLIGIMFFGEAFTLKAGIGAALVLAGLFLLFS